MHSSTVLAGPDPSPGVDRRLERGLLVGASCGGVFGLALMVPDIVAHARGEYVEDFGSGFVIMVAVVAAAMGVAAALLAGTVWWTTRRRLRHRPRWRRALSALPTGLPALVLGQGETEFVVIAVLAVVLTLVAAPWVTEAREPPRPWPV